VPETPDSPAPFWLAAEYLQAAIAQFKIQLVLSPIVAHFYSVLSELIENCP
jgi:hypothetical protein